VSSDPRKRPAELSLGISEKVRHPRNGGPVAVFRLGFGHVWDTGA
jgi:hypothetical protein